MLQYKKINIYKKFNKVRIGFLIDKNQIINERSDKLLTQSEFAKKTNVDLRTIQRIEGGKNHAVGLMTVSKLKKYFQNQEIGGNKNENNV